MHTSDTARSDWAANSAVSSAARLARSAALLALSLSLSLAPTRSFPRLCGLGTPPWARASSLTTCTHASVPIMRTPAPWTALAWMKTTSPEGTLPKPKPLSTNHLSTRSLTTLVLSARASGRLDSSTSSSSWRFSLSSRSSLRLRVEFPFPTHQELDHSADFSHVFGPFLVQRGLGV